MKKRLIGILLIAVLLSSAVFCVKFDVPLTAADYTALGKNTVVGTFVSVDWQDETYQAYRAEYGEVAPLIGISFEEPLTLPTGETVTGAVARKWNAGNEWYAFLYSVSSYTLVGTLEYDESLAELNPPGTYNDDYYTYNPWGQYIFYIDLAQDNAPEIKEIGEFTVSGTLVYMDLQDETYQAYQEEYGEENLSSCLGISFEEPLTFPRTLPSSGETITNAVVRGRGDMPEDELNALANSGSSHRFTGIVAFDENLTDLIPPGSSNNSNDLYMYNPWGQYCFYIDSVDTTN